MQSALPSVQMADFKPHVGHIPVMREEVLEGLNAYQESGYYLDGTFGAGGHSLGILEANPENKIVAIDQDQEAIERADSFKSYFGQRFEIRKLNFAELDQLPDMGFRGMLFDLGVSSFHFDDAARGFSFREEGPLDMRMDQSCGKTAEQFLETADRESLIHAIRNYGEETSWRAVVDVIISNRGSGKLSTTTGLAELIRSVVKQKPGRRKIDPATRSFQGIRMAINDELGVIESVLPKAFERLISGGRLAVISFHSLEDRIVKRFFKKVAGRPVSRMDNRSQQERVIQAKLITRKPIFSSEEEIRQNPRSRSAKLRILEKL